MKPIQESGYGLVSSIQTRYSDLNESVSSAAQDIFLNGMNTSWKPNINWVQLTVLFALLWPLVVAGLRYQREQKRKKMFNFPTRESFAKMTVHDAWAIQLNLMDTEVSFFFMLALKFAIFSVNGIPSISSLLVKTNQLPSERVHHRYSMTSVMIAEFLAAPPDAERAKEAMSRMNNIHQTYQKAGQILNDDLLYTLGLFAYLPVQWVSKYDWRELSDMEKCALGTFWKDIGDSMEIDYTHLPSAKTGWRDGLHWLEEITEWGDKYERENMVPDTNNQKVALAAIDIMLWTTPKFMRPIATKMLLALLDDRMLKALILPTPPKTYKYMASIILDTRRYMVRYLFPPRPEFLRFTPLTAQPDENGRYFLNTYDSKPFYIKPTLFTRWLSPSAIVRRMLDLPLPGDRGDEYSPNGYQLKELGPSWIIRKKSTEDDVRAARDRLEKTHTTGCPFG